MASGSYRQGFAYAAPRLSDCLSHCATSPPASKADHGRDPAIDEDVKASTIDLFVGSQSPYCVACQDRGAGSLAVPSIPRGMCELYRATKANSILSLLFPHITDSPLRCRIPRRLHHHKTSIRRWSNAVGIELWKSVGPIQGSHNGFGRPCQPLVTSRGRAGGRILTCSSFSLYPWHRHGQKPQTSRGSLLPTRTLPHSQIQQCQVLPPGHAISSSTTALLSYSL